jgi:hypothetical protein
VLDELPYRVPGQNRRLWSVSLRQNGTKPSDIK